MVELIREGRLFDAARFDSPEAIARACVAALDILEPEIGHEPGFKAKANEVLDFANRWIREVDPVYARFLETTRNVSFTPGFEDVLRGVEYAVTGVTLAGVIVDLGKQLLLGAMSGDVEKAARYRAAVLEFQDRIGTYIAIEIVGRRGGR
ncbi:MULTISPECIES: hypothetical protein [unclassified Sphingomonas]|nr:MULTISPECIES: hypothetical protein [unclassified Sphingomonas]